ncbi:Armadillo-like helical [Cucumis melo var. makuwa]|uniref:Armadillo-like helical n=1 Tax=Cucumis melo var. makuwa TaxID=1194695 RepID=A0A5A7ULD1_CUCMM|nr:Armadillo-like helical [Cucumis melo var. makuwa]
MDCIVKKGYFGRKDTVDAMLEEDLIDRLVELQRSELGGGLIGLGKHTAEESREVPAGSAGEKRVAIISCGCVTFSEYSPIISLFLCCWYFSCAFWGRRIVVRLRFRSSYGVPSCNPDKISGIETREWNCRKTNNYS